MPEYVRIRDKQTGHQFSIPAHRFDADRHAKTGRDAVDERGEPLPVKYQTTVNQAADKKKPGQKADSNKEKN